MEYIGPCQDKQCWMSNVKQNVFDKLGAEKEDRQNTSEWSLSRMFEIDSVTVLKEIFFDRAAMGSSHFWIVK